ncbi:Uncharacterized protein APZ42_007445, partial [Daphnia magna]
CPSVNNPTGNWRRQETIIELPSTSHANDGNSSKSRLVWLEADVFRLISIWREFNEKPKYRQIGKTLSLWSDIAIELAKDGGPRYSGSQIHIKYKNLVQKYK